MILDNYNIQEFSNKTITPILEKKLYALKRYYKQNCEQLSNEIIKAFKDLLTKAIRLQNDGGEDLICFIVFSGLRSSVYSDACLFRIDAYDKDFYADNKECCVKFEMSFIRDSLLEFEEEIISGMNKSSIKLPSYVIEALVIRESVKFFNIMHYLLRYTVTKIETLKELEALRSHEILDIRFGEYFDITHTIYQYDRRVLDPAATKAKLEKKTGFHYESVKNIDLSNGNYDGVDLRFSDFSGCSFEGSSFRDCNLIGTSWRNCNLENADFSNSDLSGADFRGVSQETTLFENTILSNTFW